MTTKNIPVFAWCLRNMAALSMDLMQPFPHLPGAPIVEAVIDWRARATKAWQRDELQKNLAARLPAYPKAEPQHIFEVTFKAEMGQEAVHQQSNWRGLRLLRDDKLCIGQFTRDGLVFSRLSPYEGWDHFVAESRRLWNVFVELGEPMEIQRLGVRYINRIALAGVDNLKDYLREPPSLSSDFPLNGFLYQSTFNVPGHAMGISVVKTIQPANAGLTTAAGGLIIDIDVFTNKPLLCEDRVVDEYLPKLRWLKNKVFFDLLTTEAIGKFRMR